jgi:hypothetical protein
MNYPNYFTADELKILAFYNGGEEPSAPRLNDIKNWFANFSEELETRHDWVQWAFPIDTPSQFNPDAPIVTHPEVFSYVRKDELISNIIRMCSWLGIYLYKNVEGQYSHNYARIREWYESEDHNNLRVTRLLRCLRLAGMALERDLLMDILNEVAFRFGRKPAVDYWEAA